MSKITGIKEFEELKELIKRSGNIDCDIVTNKNFWKDEWTECPVCGAKPDNDGIWVHDRKLN